MSYLNLGCTVNRVAIIPGIDKVDLFVPRNPTVDMGQAIAYAEEVLDTVKCVMVLEGPHDTLFVRYLRLEDGWVAEPAERWAGNML